MSALLLVPRSICVPNGCASAGARTCASGAAPDRPPGSPGQASPRAAVSAREIRYAKADVAFMQGMIGHQKGPRHGGAARDAHPDAGMKLLAQRIKCRQDEIRFMQRWLQTVRDGAARACESRDDFKPMPGMLSLADMRSLPQRRTEFDRLFLEFMIKHHDGALYGQRPVQAGRRRPGS